MGYENFEKKARNDKELIKKIANGCFYQVAQQDSLVKEVFFEEYKKQIPEIKEKYIVKKRNVFPYEDEVKNVEEAFEKGIVRIPIEYAVNFDEAKQIAEKMAAGLPTRQELIESGAHEADG